MKISILLLAVTSITGCGLPMPLSYFSYGWTAYDTHQIVHGDETATDAVLSKATGMDCQISNALEDREVCVRKVKMK